MRGLKLYDASIVVVLQEKPFAIQCLRNLTGEVIKDKFYDLSSENKYQILNANFAGIIDREVHEGERYAMFIRPTLEEVKIKNKRRKM